MATLMRRYLRTKNEAGNSIEYLKKIIMGNLLMGKWDWTRKDDLASCVDLC